MKKIFLFLVLFLFANEAQARIKIFACEPEWSSLAYEIVRDKAEIKVAMNANQDARKIKATTALVSASRGSDLIFCSGGELEKSWLPTLLNKSYNLKVITDPQKYILYAYDYVKKLPNHDLLNSSEINKYGQVQLNLRTHLNPHNIEIIGAEFTNRMKIIDPINARFYQKSYDNFLVRWHRAVTKWEDKGRFLQGKTFIANDNSWDYLADWLGFQVTTLEGLRAGKLNFKNLSELVTALRTEPAEAIIFARHEDKTSLFWLRDSSKTRMVLLPFTVGNANSRDLFQLFNLTVNSLLTDCSSGVCRTLILPEEN